MIFPLLKSLSHYSRSVAKNKLISTLIDAVFTHSR
jgi:hypothetical protein